MTFEELEKEMDRVKDRRNSLWPQSIETMNAILEFEKGLDRNAIMWHWLSVVRNTPHDKTESIIERLSIPPWESNDPDVKMVWAYIVRKENIPYLKTMVAVKDHNRVMKETYQIALSMAENSA